MADGYAGWLFDEDSLIDACINPALMDELGFDVIRRLLITMLPAIQADPKRARVYVVDGEPVYFVRTSPYLRNGHRPVTLVVTYTLAPGRIIDLLWVFKASDVDTTLLPKKWKHPETKLPDRTERLLKRQLLAARRRRRH